MRLIPCIFTTMNHVNHVKNPDFHTQLIISPMITPKVLRTGRRSCGSQRLLGTGTKWNFRKFVSNTPLKLNMEPENQPLEKEIPIGNPSFSGSMLNFGRVTNEL